MPAEADNAKKVRGFSVEISGAGAKSEDNAWESCTGGALNLEISQTTTPGHKSVEEITLRGPLTAGRKSLCDWINASAAASSPSDPAVRRAVRITEILDGGQPGRSDLFLDCFITHYTYPRLSADNSGNTLEEVRIKPVRCELK